MLHYSTSSCRKAPPGTWQLEHIFATVTSQLNIQLLSSEQRSGCSEESLGYVTEPLSTEKIPREGPAIILEGVGMGKSY